MLENFLSMFTYPFMIRALVVGILISLCAALLGVTLVLKRYSMIGDGLSHVGFGALAVAAVCNAAPLAVAIPVVVISAFFLLRLSESSKIKGDSAIAVISTSALAAGVMVLSLGDGMALSLGVPVKRMRLLALVCASASAAAAVSFAGLLGFVGLIVPHLARRLVGEDLRFLLPASAMTGGILVVLADLFGRTLFAPTEVPVGIVMALIGAPFFLILLLGGKKHA